MTTDPATGPGNAAAVTASSATGANAPAGSVTMSTSTAPARFTPNVDGRVYYCLCCEQRAAHEGSFPGDPWPWWHRCDGCGYVRCVIPD